MNNQTIVLSLSAMLWFFLAYRFVRALGHKKLRKGASLHAWAIFFLVYFIALLTVDSIEAWIDLRMGGFPLATLVRSLLMLFTAQLYFLAIQTMYARPTLGRYLSRLTTADAGLCIGFFVGSMAFHLTSRDVIIYVIKDFRDVIMAAWTMLIFVPVSVKLWRNERVRPMKLHRVIDLAFWAAFLTETVAGIAFSLALVLNPRWEIRLLALDRVSTYLCYLLILTALMPYRWLMPVFYPRKVLLYLRLRQLQRVVEQESYGQSSSSGLASTLSHPDEIELAIYRTTIAILDTYPSMKGTGRVLQEQIQRLVETDQEYSKLVQQMASLRK